MSPHHRELTWPASAVKSRRILSARAAAAGSAIVVRFRYVQSIGSRIQISAVFGDDHYILRGTVTEPV
jgi:hypothetical protein